MEPIPQAFQIPSRPGQEKGSLPGFAPAHNGSPTVHVHPLSPATRGTFPPVSPPTCLFLSQPARCGFGQHIIPLGTGKAGVTLLPMGWTALFIYLFIFGSILF
jgi:hypothetical protein